MSSRGSTRSMRPSSVSSKSTRTVSFRAPSSKSNKKKKSKVLKLTAGNLRKLGLNKPASRPRTRTSTARSTRSSKSATLYFDGANRTIPPALSTMGKYFPINGMIRRDAGPTGLLKNAFFFTIVPGYSTVGISVSIDPVTAPAVAPTISTLSIPLLATPAGAGGPSSSKASKLSVDVENITARLNVAGKVFVANLQQRINFSADPTGLTAALWDSEVFTAIKAFPETQVYSGSHFIEAKRMMCRVVDDPDYLTFDQHRGPMTHVEFFRAIGVWPTSAETIRPMTTIVVIFETVGSSPTIGQDYILTAHSQHLTRWPLNTVPGQAMIESKASDAKTVNASRAST